ncbi:proton-coupled zinc antiporter SLC30A2-like isoform X2 [Saccostrea echinata]|uniref:proton-coupled zinc antiporter SLC30A2-like isoform X2 n=1 Tax=Saccostrea echinata TaxID=191078 RepID=UPI002A836EB7|nr:proton-coupled zinc antiporter SLC30A2-like isoform X2 [Saccostrea echinata]
MTDLLISPSRASPLLGASPERNPSPILGHRCFSAGMYDREVDPEIRSILHDIEESSEQGHHCHTTKEKTGVDKKARRKLIIASTLCLLFMVGEIVGGVLAGSLAIISDAAHLLTDFASFMISLLAIMLASRSPSKRFSFGWYRAEILGALLSILFLWILTGVLFYMAVRRVIHQNYTIDATIMLITAACGVAFNIIMGISLGHGHNHSHKKSSPQIDIPQSSRQLSVQEDVTHPSYGAINSNTSETEPLIQVKDTHKENINVKAAFIHVVGDLIQSIGVLIAAFIIYFKPEWRLADPICTFVFSLIVMVTTFKIFLDIITVLMEGTPRGIDITSVRKTFLKLPGVKDVHDLRLWSLSMDKIALSVHLAVDSNTDPLKILKLGSTVVRLKYGISETTIQVEEHVQGMDDCTHCQDAK